MKKTLFNGIKYPVGKLFENIATTYKFFIKSNEIAFSHLAKYNYNAKENSMLQRYHIELYGKS